MYMQHDISFMIAIRLGISISNDVLLCRRQKTVIPSYTCSIPTFRYTDTGFRISRWQCHAYIYFDFETSSQHMVAGSLKYNTAF